MNLIVALNQEINYVSNHYWMRLPAHALVFSRGRRMLEGLRLSPSRGKLMSLIGVVNLDLNDVLSRYSVLVAQTRAFSEGPGTLDLMGLLKPEEFWVPEICPTLAQWAPAFRVVPILLGGRLDLTGSLLDEERVLDVPVKLMR